MDNFTETARIQVDEEHALVIGAIAGCDGQFLTYECVYPEIGFHFSILCECNDSAQSVFRDAIARHNIKTNRVEIDVNPWIADLIQEADPTERLFQLERKVNERLNATYELYREQQTPKTAVAVNCIVVDLTAIARLIRDGETRTKRHWKALFNRLENIRLSAKRLGLTSVSDIYRDRDVLWLFDEAIETALLADWWLTGSDRGFAEWRQENELL